MGSYNFDDVTWTPSGTALGSLTVADTTLTQIHATSAGSVTASSLTTPINAPIEVMDISIFWEPGSPGAEYVYVYNGSDAVIFGYQLHHVFNTTKVYTNGVWTEVLPNSSTTRFRVEFNTVEKTVEVFSYDSIDTLLDQTTFAYASAMDIDTHYLYLVTEDRGGETNDYTFTLNEPLQYVTTNPSDPTDKPRLSPEFFPSQTVGFGDIEFDQATMDLSVEEGLDSTFFLAVYTDSRANNNDEMPNNDGDKRGWWGDELIGLDTGSRAWLYSERGKLTNANVLKIQDSMREAVDRQMIETGLIDDVDISYELRSQGVEWNVKLSRKKKTSINLQYLELWDGQIDKITKEVVS